MFYFVLFIGLILFILYKFLNTFFQDNKFYECNDGVCVESLNKIVTPGMLPLAECSAACIKTPRFSCSTSGDGKCISDQTGTFTSETCDNKCVVLPPPKLQKYSCKDLQCVSDDGGTFGTADCDGGCTNEDIVKSLRDGELVQCKNTSCMGYSSGAKLSAKITTSDSTTELVKNISNTLSIGGSFPVQAAILKPSIYLVTNKDSSNVSTIKTACYDISVESGSVYLLNNSNCMNESKIDPAFLQDFYKLSINIGSPENPSSWEPYMNFISNYGSHVITRITYGSRFQQWESTTDNSADAVKKLNLKVCLKTSGIIDSQACDGFTEEMKNSVKSYDTYSYRIILGGSNQTRIDMMSLDPHNPPDVKKVTAFLNSSNVSNQAIAYEFTPIWELLAKYIRGTCDVNAGLLGGTTSNAQCDNLQRCLNIEAAFAFTMLPCDPKSTGGVIYQQFRIDPTKNTGPVKTYECWNKKTGCSQDDDCTNYKSKGCTAGSFVSTFDAGDIVGDPAANVRRTALRNYHTGGAFDGVNASCNYSSNRARCACNKNWNGGLPDRNIWTQGFF